MTALLLALAAGLQDPAAAPAHDDRERARAAFADGQAAFEAQEFESAAASFELAFDITGSADLAFNVALCHERLGRDEAAARWYRAYLEARPDAADRVEVEARIVALEAGAGTPAADAQPVAAIAPHRLRLGVGWEMLPGGAVASGGTPAPVDAHGFHLAAAYHLRLVNALALEAGLGATRVSAIQGTSRTAWMWSVAVGLAWLWTSPPWVDVGVRGDFGLYVYDPSAGDLHWLVPFRAGAWIEAPLADWMAIHAGGDLGIGPYVSRDDKSFGFVVQVAAGVTFSLGGNDAAPEPEEPPARPEPRPRRAPVDDLGRGWQ